MGSGAVAGGKSPWVWGVRGDLSQVIVMDGRVICTEQSARIHASFCIIRSTVGRVLCVDLRRRAWSGTTFPSQGAINQVRVLSSQGIRGRPGDTAPPSHSLAADSWAQFIVVLFGAGCCWSCVIAHGGMEAVVKLYSIVSRKNIFHKKNIWGCFGAYFWASTVGGKLIMRKLLECGQ